MIYSYNMYYNTASVSVEISVRNCTDFTFWTCKEIIIEKYFLFQFLLGLGVVEISSARVDESCWTQRSDVLVYPCNQVTVALMLLKKAAMLQLCRLTVTIVFPSKINWFCIVFPLCCPIHYYKSDSLFALCLVPCASCACSYALPQAVVQHTEDVWHHH